MDFSTNPTDSGPDQLEDPGIYLEMFFDIGARVIIYKEGQDEDGIMRSNFYSGTITDTNDLSLGFQTSDGKDAEFLFPSRALLREVAIEGFDATEIYNEHIFFLKCSNDVWFVAPYNEEVDNFFMTWCAHVCSGRPYSGELM